MLRAAPSEMAGRESRARLLMPSFLVVTAAMACGQSDDANDSATNPPGFNGSGAGGSAGTGQVVTAGTVSNPPFPTDCPLQEPRDGQSCSWGFRYAGSCEYPGRPDPCGFATSATQAECVEGVWVVELGSSGVSCNPPMPVPCPAELPMAGQLCRQGFQVYPAACGYTTPDCPTITARCAADGAWQVDTGGCVPPSEGGAGGQGGGAFEPAAGAANEASAGAGGAP